MIALKDAPCVSAHQRLMMEHALGRDYPNKTRDYRNYYVLSYQDENDVHAWLQLIRLQLATARFAPETIIFYVTDKGKEFLAMTAPITATLNALESRVEELNEMDTKISQHIADVEKSLTKFVSIAVELAVPNGPNIGFGKHDGVWRLLYNDKPLASMPRGDRSDAFTEGWIEQLIQALPALLDEIYSERMKALTKARDLLTQMDYAIEAKKI